MKKTIVMMVFAIAMVTTVSCNKKETTETTTEPTTTEQTAHEHKEGDTHQLAYACPMDCENGKTYDKPGKCPVCEMDLTEVESHEGHQH